MEQSGKRRPSMQGHPDKFKRAKSEKTAKLVGLLATKLEQEQEKKKEWTPELDIRYLFSPI